MSDNTTLNAGANGDVIGSDDISGVKYQRNKLIFGNDGVNNGDVSSDNPLPVVNSNTAALISALRALVHPIWEEAATGRLRVVLDPLGGAQTLALVTTVGTVTTVTTVGTVSNMSNIGGVSANSMVLDTMHGAWGGTVRRAVV